MRPSKEAFLKLIRLGIGQQIDSFPENINWAEIKARAERQCLMGVVLDGIEVLRQQCFDVSLPEKRFMVQWIGEVLQDEGNNALQKKEAVDMALLFHGNYIRTYVLKGSVVAECYPNPEHRTSVDMDCYLMPDKGDFDAWSFGNDLIKAKGFEVSFDFYKNSAFNLPGLIVENHKYFTPFRGNKTLKNLEIRLQRMMKEDKGEDRFDGTWLCRPPVMVSALFLIEHAYSHFLHEGLTWRMVLDWQLFSSRHRDEIDWQEFQARVDEFGFRRFYDSFSRLGKYLVGELVADGLQPMDLHMLSDIWSPLDLHDSVTGWRGKLALAGNTWRARWKYRQFTDMSWLKALWIQAKGVLLEKEPKI